MSNGKERPDWMGGPQTVEDRPAQSTSNGGEANNEGNGENTARSNPDTESSAAEKRVHGADHVDGSMNSTDRAQHVQVVNPNDAQSKSWQPLAGDPPETTRHSSQSYPYKNSSGRKSTGRIGSAISAFFGRLTGRNWGNTSAKDADANNQPLEATPKESPAEVERRLKLALRETAVDGFCRVCFGSPKGGVGKSSMAYAVAGALAEGTNLRVCLVDADPNFGATRFLVPRPIESSVLDLAEDADRLERLADLRSYVSQNEQMGLDVLLNPVQAAQIAHVEDLAEAYERIDSVLSRFYDLVVYDLGLGFRDPAIRRVLSLSDELVFVSDAEVIPNAQLSDALEYVKGLGVDLSRTTLAINHRLPRTHESAPIPQIRSSHASYVRRVTEVPYDAAFSKGLNTRNFHIDLLEQPTRLGVLTTAGAALEGLRRDGAAAAYEKVVSLAPSTDPRANISSSSNNISNNGLKGGM